MKTERDEALDIFEGKFTPAVRILYRRPPERKWTRILVSPEDGLTLEDVESEAKAIAEHHETMQGE